MAGYATRAFKVKGVAGAVARTYQDKAAEALSVWDFMTQAQRDEIASGVAYSDMTAPINTALEAGKALRRPVYAPGGKYRITQIVVPSGVDFFGAGVGGYGSQLFTNADDVTVFMQMAGVNDDAIVFDMPLQSGFYRLFNVHMHDFVLLKETGADTIGNGISVRQVGTDRALLASHGLINAITVFERLLVRGFPEDGHYCRQGAAPGYFNDLDYIFNGGYGLRIDGANYMRGVNIRNIAGDGNKGRAVLRIGAAPADNLISIDGVFAEFRSDSPYGNTAGFTGAQPDAIEIVDCGDNTVVSVKNVYGNSIVADTAMRSAIFVNASSQATTPTILFDAISLRKTGLASGSKYSLYDNRLGTGVPSSIRSGFYSLNETPMAFVSGFTVFGEASLSKPPVGTEGVQVKGNTPAVSWWESDAAADSKGWTFGPSGGNLYLRTYNDALATNDIVMTYVRSGGLVTRIEAQKELRATAKLSATALGTFADDTAAGAGGYVSGNIYKTATGELRIKL
ncbi:MAG TPA: hypothetical protein VJ673_02705 [Aromatoleum sp.]|uniref:hypothetical protein n=1 Tax=Aromatoleum sp. TaxID=2307007 RepID=UPI002B48177F|nr:hypothetical protein [Aromatoleum sp.]HJV24563.1 hypothetical protein [Aromatoleum sp.]